MTHLTPVTQRVLDDLPAIDERAARATPGPWEFFQDRFCYGDPFEREHLSITSSGNAAFIAAARSDVPMLCVAVRELHIMLQNCCRNVAELEEALARCTQDAPEGKHG